MTSKQRVGRAVAGLGLAVLSGWLLFLALPPQKVGALAWVALVPGIWAQFLLAPDDRVARLYQAVTYLLGIGMLVFIAFPPHLVPAPVPVLVPVVIAAVLVGGGIFALGLPTGDPSFHRQTGFRFLVPGAAVAWVGLEFLRMQAQLGQIWGLLATSQVGNAVLRQLAALGGPWLLSLLIVAVNYALALGGIALFSPADRPQARRPAAVSLLIVGLLLAGAGAGGTLREKKPVNLVRVATLQPGAELGDVPAYYLHWWKRDWESLSQAVLDDLAFLTRQAAAGGAELVVWPEASLWLDPQENAVIRERLLTLAGETGVTLVVPYFLLPPEGPLGWWLGFAEGMRNEVVLVTPEGESLGPSAKSHPIPFIGERSDTRGLMPVYSLPFASVGALLGYDTAFTDSARHLAGRGAQLLTLSTHAWAEMSAAYEAHTCLRAVENGVVVVKSDWEVGSLIVDPWGEVLSRTASHRPTRRVLLADVPLLPAGGTPYTHSGDALGWLSLGGMVLFLALARKWPRRKRYAPEEALRGGS